MSRENEVDTLGGISRNEDSRQPLSSENWKSGNSPKWLIPGRGEGSGLISFEATSAIQSLVFQGSGHTMKHDWSRRFLALLRLGAGSAPG